MTDTTVLTEDALPRVRALAVAHLDQLTRQREAAAAEHAAAVARERAAYEQKVTALAIEHACAYITDHLPAPSPPSCRPPTGPATPATSTSRPAPSPRSATACGCTTP